MFDPDTSLEATDLVVRDTRPDDMGLGGRGFSVEDSARLVAERLLVAGNQEVGLFANTSVDVTLVDAAILDTTPQPPASAWGLAAAVGGASTLTATRVEIARAQAIGLIVHTGGTRATLTSGTMS